MENPPSELDLKTDECYYAMEYLPTTRGGSFQESEAVSRIQNFKKPAGRKKNPLEWRYKIQAIRQFAEDLSTVLPARGKITVAAIPPANLRTDPDYDSRFDDLFADLGKIVGAERLVVVEPIRAKRSRTAAHGSSGKRTPERFRADWEWTGFRVVPSVLIVVDDVILSGSQYRAYKNMVLEHHPKTRVVGVFWARSIR